jgi:hypothetical protein
VHTLLPLPTYPTANEKNQNQQSFIATGATASQHSKDSLCTGQKHKKTDHKPLQNLWLRQAAGW